MTDPMSVMELRPVLAELTPSQRTRIVRLAVKIGRQNNYCDEMIRLLNLMGFVVPPLGSDNEVDAYHDPQEE